MVYKLKNLNGDNFKTPTVTKLKKSNWDKIKKKIKLWQNWKTESVTKLKNSNSDQSQNSNCDKFKWWQNSNCDKTQKLKFWQNSNNQIVTKIKINNCDKTKKN